MVPFQRFYWTRILIVTVLTLGLLGPTALASQLDNKRQELKRVKTKIEINRRMINAAQKRQSDIVREISLSDKKIYRLQIDLAKIEPVLNKTMARKAQVEFDLHKMEKKLQISEAGLTIVEKKLAFKKEFFNKRIRNAYKRGKSNTLEAILSSRDLGDLLQRASLINMILENDAELVSELKQSKALVEKRVGQVRTEKTEVANKRQILIREENRYRAIRNRFLTQRSQLQAEINKQKNAYAKLQKDKSQLEAALNALEGTSNTIADQIRTLERGGRISVSRGYGRASMGGRFIWPCPGPITSGFGYRFHPVLKYSRLHAGVDFRAPHGTVIRAAQSGTVIMAGWRGGYGKAVVISHGNGISTLYGHNSRLLVSYGQSVSQGQPIAYSGSTGLSTGPHLHFEVRVNGTPRNPMNWL